MNSNFTPLASEAAGKVYTCADPVGTNNVLLSPTTKVFPSDLIGCLVTIAPS